VRVIEQEVDMVQTLEKHREDLAERFDFNSVEAFNLLQRRGPEHSISPEQLLKFIKRNGETFYDEDILSLMRRFDKDGDARLSFTEFQ